MHSELDFRPVQIITGHVIYNSPYKYWPDENYLAGHSPKSKQANLWIRALYTRLLIQALLWIFQIYKSTRSLAGI